MSSINKKLRHMVVYAAFAMAGTFLHSAQSDKKLSASLRKGLVKSGQAVGGDNVLAQYFTCIDNLQIVPTVLAELIAQYASGKRKFSHDKVIFQNDHQQLASAILLSPRYLATGASGDCNIKLWDYKEAFYMHIIGKHGTPITALTALPNPFDSFASGSRDGIIKIWNFRTGKHQRTFYGNDQAITALAAFSSWLLSASNNSVRAWNVRTGICVGILERSTRDEVNTSGIDPSMETIHGYASITMNSEKTFNPVVSLIPISDGRVYEVSTKNIFQLIIDSGKLSMRIHYHTETDDIRGATLADGNILIATTKPCLKILSSGHGKRVASIPLKHPPTCLAYHDDTAFIGHANGSVTVIHIPTKSCMQELHAHKHNYGGVDYSISSILPLDNGSIIVACLHGCMHSFIEKLLRVDGA